MAIMRLYSIKALLEKLNFLDEQLFLIINTKHSSVIDPIANGISHISCWIPLYLFLLHYIIKKLGKKSWAMLLAVVILIILCDQFASGLMKPLVQRWRPCLNPILSSKVHVVGPYHGAYGFISSHAANSFGIVTFFSLVFEPQLMYRILLYSWAAVISYGRIYGGVHYPGDVLVGAMSGVFWGYVVYKLYIKIKVLN